MARADLAGEGAFYYDTSHDQRAPAKVLAGLRAGFEARHWGVYAWVRNLLDERYATRGFYFGNEPPDFPPKLYLRLGDPRQFGVVGEWRL
jgi:outer membrane receptor protein involved in Fe transport